MSLGCSIGLHGQCTVVVAVCLPAAAGLHVEYVWIIQCCGLGSIVSEPPSRDAAVLLSVRTSSDQVDWKSNDPVDCLHACGSLAVIGAVRIPSRTAHTIVDHSLDCLSQTPPCVQVAYDSS